MIKKLQNVEKVLEEGMVHISELIRVGLGLRSLHQGSVFSRDIDYLVSQTPLNDLCTGSHSICVCHFSRNFWVTTFFLFKKVVLPLVIWQVASLEGAVSILKIFLTFPFS